MVRLREPNQLPIEAERTKARIEKDSARFPERQCPKCGGRCFQRHQKHRRWFTPVIEQIVYPIHCWLYRWRCVICGTTFMHLSTLCVAFKRYLRDEIEARARTYVENDSMSYRQVVKDRGAAVVHDGPITDGASTEAEKEKELVPELAPSTVHRWIGAIAACRKHWQPAVRLARQLQQEARLRSSMIAAVKYRSQARKRVLETCGLLLRAMSILADTKPTQLATLGSSP